MKILPHPYHPDSDTIFGKLRNLPGRVWLDSGKPGSSKGRYDIISALPSDVVKPTLKTAVDVLSVRLNPNISTPPPLPFIGGWMGYLPYEFRHEHFGIPTANQPAKAWFGWYDWAVIVDHALQQSHLLFTDTCPPKTRRTVLTYLKSPPSANNKTLSATVHFQPDVNRECYLEAIHIIQEHLLAGDCYQVNLSQRFSALFSGDPAEVYQILRKVVPSPYSAFIDTGDLEILSISPERFIGLNGERVITQPIKGTITRLQDPTADERQKSALQNSDKNRAENVMIVDLLRNDLSQHCVPGSVKASRLFEVQSFANVHHLVSTIEGILPRETDPVTFLLDCFPGGSITGAPKKRAMEIIDRLETHRRGPYCGSIGYLTHGRRFDFNIAIRTLVKQNQQLLAWAGGGIVVDSTAENEYQETLDKISAFLNSL